MRRMLAAQRVVVAALAHQTATRAKASYGQTATLRMRLAVRLAHRVLLAVRVRQPFLLQIRTLLLKEYRLKDYSAALLVERGKVKVGQITQAVELFLTV